jgi:hypothetical protein
MIETSLKNGACWATVTARESGMQSELNGIVDALPGSVWTARPDVDIGFFRFRSAGRKP